MSLFSSIIGVDVVERIETERRKASWQWALARWSAGTAPFLCELGIQLFLFASLGFFVGTGIVARLFGLNLLLSFIIAEVAALMALYVFRKMKRRSLNR
jgi:amino acid transporter